MRKLTERQIKEDRKNKKIETAISEGSAKVITIKVIESSKAIFDIDGEHHIATDENGTQYDTRNIRFRKGSTHFALITTHSAKTFVDNEVLESVNTRDENSDEIKSGWMNSESTESTVETKETTMNDYRVYTKTNSGRIIAETTVQADNPESAQRKAFRQAKKDGLIPAEKHNSSYGTMGWVVSNGENQYRRSVVYGDRFKSSSYDLYLEAIPKESI